MDPLVPGSHGRSTPSLAFGVLLLLAFAQGLATTRGLEWPGTDPYGVGIDLYRDIGMARTILESGYGPDPAYLGERNWYNPLVPAMTAAASGMSGVDVPVVAVRIGTYANLLAPVAFYLLVRSLAGAWIALYASAGFLFLTSSTLPSWMSATYSPWFLPVNFAQAIFYVTLWSYVLARRSTSRTRYVWPGVLWGLTFLGHTAPALLFGYLVVAMEVAEVARKQIRPHVAASRLGTMALLALMVSSPFVGIIAGHYGLRLRNVGPSSYTDPLLARELPRLLLMHLTVPMAVAAVGAWRVGRSQMPALTRAVLMSWGAVAATFLIYGYVVLGARLGLGLTLPSLVPSFHFFFYLKALTAILFGLGVAALANRVSAWMATRGAGVAGSAGPEWTGAALCALLLLAGIPTYLSRPDFTVTRADALATIGSDQQRVSRWLRANRRPQDVVLASVMDAATIVGPAGPKTVVIASAFSNPYVDFESRADAADRLFTALDSGDVAAFADVANRFSVSLVIARGARGRVYAGRTDGPLVEAFVSGEIHVFRRRDVAEAHPAEDVRPRPSW